MLAWAANRASTRAVSSANNKAGGAPGDEPGHRCVLRYGVGVGVSVGGPRVPVGRGGVGVIVGIGGRVGIVVGSEGFGSRYTTGRYSWCWPAAATAPSAQNAITTATIRWISVRSIYSR
jgi:hypothetical protein